MAKAVEEAMAAMPKPKPGRKAARKKPGPKKAKSNKAGRRRR
jgi:hypothetical protein